MFCVCCICSVLLDVMFVSCVMSGWPYDCAATIIIIIVIIIIIIIGSAFLTGNDVGTKNLKFKHQDVISLR